LRDVKISGLRERVTDCAAKLVRYSLKREVTNPPLQIRKQLIAAQYFALSAEYFVVEAAQYFALAAE
jgi:hypothetical protein